MSYDKALIAHKLQRWDQYITKYHLPQWDSIPDFGLYMDQVVLLLERYLSFIPPVNEEKERIVTASAINNYVRLKLMPAPVKRKYYRVHICYLIMILTLKQSIGISQVQKIIPWDLADGQDGPEPLRKIYEDYSGKFRGIALLFNRQIQQSWEDLCAPDAGTDGVARCLVMESALLAGFSKILAEKLLRLWEADPQAVLDAEQPHDFSAN